MTATLAQILRVIADKMRQSQLRARDRAEAVLARHDPALYANVSWPPDFARRQADAGNAARAAGCHLGALQGGPVSLKDLYGVEGLPTFAGTPRALRAAWSTGGPLVTSLRRQLATMVDEESALTAAAYLKRKARCGNFSVLAAVAFGRFGALICPTVGPTPPPVALREDAVTGARPNLLNLRNICVVNFLGLCAVLLRAGVDAQSLPVGLQLIGPPNSDARLLAIARRIERLRADAGVWQPPHLPD